MVIVFSHRKKHLKGSHLKDGQNTINVQMGMIAHTLNALSSKAFMVLQSLLCA